MRPARSQWCARAACDSPAYWWTPRRTPHSEPGRIPRRPGYVWFQSWRTVDSDKEAVAQRASGLSRRWSGMAEAERGREAGGLFGPHRLPELNAIALRVAKGGEATIGIAHRIYFYRFP